MKISTKLFIVYLSFALVILIPIGIFLFVSAVNQVEVQIQQSLDEKADHIFDKMDRVLFERYSDMLTLSNDPIFQGKVDLNSISKKLIAYRNQKKVYISLSYFDEKCIKLVDTIGLGIGEPCQETEWKKDVYSNLRISSASDLFYDHHIKKKVIAFATPILNKNGELKGAIAALISIGNLRQILNGTLQENESVYVDLVNQNLQLIDSNHLFIEDKIFAKLKEEEILRDPSKYIYSKTEEEGFLDFTGNGWILYLQYPKSEAFLPITHLRNQVSFLGSIIIFFSFLIILFLTRKTIQPLLKLKDAALALGSGDLTSRVQVNSNDEIGQLSLSFNKMADELNDSLNTLEQKKCRITKNGQVKG